MFAVQAYKLSTGWQCRSICHLCSGCEWGNPTDDAAWCHDDVPTPYKEGELSPFLDIPGANAARYMTLDYCHAFHLGDGLDMAASTICLMARLGCFGMGAFDVRLHEGFRRFMVWCKLNKRATSLHSFSRLDFDMASTLVAVTQLFCLLDWNWNRNVQYNEGCKMVWGQNMYPRNNDFPMSLNGKAYDTAVVLAWVEAEQGSQVPLVFRLLFLRSLFRNIFSEMDVGIWWNLSSTV